jgi:hypothetical protein
MQSSKKHVIERRQTGVRMEKNLLKVLRAFADYQDLTLGDLLEGIVLHVFDGKVPFGRNSLQRIKELKRFYGLDLDSRASHRLTEVGGSDALKKSTK